MNARIVGEWFKTLGKGDARHRANDPAGSLRIARANKLAQLVVFAEARVRSGPGR